MFIDLVEVEILPRDKRVMWHNKWEPLTLTHLNSKFDAYRSYGNRSVFILLRDTTWPHDQR